METKRTESRLGRFSYLLKGRAKPRRSLALMMALVIVAVMSFAGVVSADSYYEGIVPGYWNWGGTVNGDLWVKWNGAWNITPVTDWSQQTNTSTFTGIPATGTNVKNARLYVVPYVGSSTASYTGNISVDWTGDGVTTPLSSHELLNLTYPPTTPPNTPPYTPTIRTGPTTESPDYLLYLNRVTSDYVIAYDVTSLVNASTITVDIHTWNDTHISGNKFDGRIKEAQLVIAYDDGGSEVVRYWVNEGHDASTYFNPDYVGVTTFSGIPDVENISDATLYTNDIASANGNYSWIDPTNYITPSITTSNSYARLNQFTIDDPSSITEDDPNYFYYDRNGTNNYYKLAVAILKLTY